MTAVYVFWDIISLVTLSKLFQIAVCEGAFTEICEVYVACHTSECHRYIRMLDKFLAEIFRSKFIQ